jgi:post-segregation antitoxin (ccd killing protein)
MLSKWFSKAPARPSVYSPNTEPLTSVVWQATHALPIPDWDALQPLAGMGDQQLHQFWSSAAIAWLNALGKSFDAPLNVYESAEFLVLSALTPRESEVLLDYAEKALKRNKATLQGIASDEGFGKFVILVMPSEDDYYRYVSEYYPQSGEFALSGGMYIHNGYGHFVFCKGSMDSMEPVLVHELAHALVQHLPLPAWVNEGLAVNTERRWAPRPAQHKPHELAYMHSRFWNDSTMQEFWSGKSFLRPDDGNALSYDLAQRLIALVGQDHETLVRFANIAVNDDGAARAAQDTLGVAIETLVTHVIGAEFAAPMPEKWSQGNEKGWF